MSCTTRPVTHTADVAVNSASPKPADTPARRATGSISSFDDAAKVSGYATTAMKWAVGAGIIGGSNNKLDPQGNATRAQVAVMLHRFLNK